MNASPHRFCEGSFVNGICTHCGAPGAAASMVEVSAMTERIADCVALLRVSVGSADCLTARYAVATIGELSDRIETGLLAVERDAKALRSPLSVGDWQTVTTPYPGHAMKPPGQRR